MASKSTPSPYSLSLTALISLHCEQPEASPLYSDLEDPFKSHERVQLFLQGVLNGESFAEAMLSSRTVKSLIDSIQLEAGEEISSNFLNFLEVASASIDSLVDLMALARNATLAGAVDAMSLTGSFVRQVSLGFEESPFDVVARLWKCFKSEVQQAASLPGTTQTQRTSEWIQHPDQIESGLRHLLQNEGSMDGIVKSIFEDDPTSSNSNDANASHKLLEQGNLPSLHLLKFLNSTRQGERVESIEQLHSYFDRALVRSQEDGDSKGTSRHLMQFAPVLLSALHCKTGNTEISKLATEEAARVAQNSQDPACVAFALGWLYENSLSSGHLGDANILNRCAHRASEGNRQNLLTGAELLRVRQALASSKRDQRNASQAWGHLFDAISELPSTEAASNYDRPTRTTHVPNAKVCLAAMARQRIVASAVWESFGQNTAAALSSLICLLCHENLSSEDARSAIQNVARHSLSGSQSLLRTILDGKTKRMTQKPNIPAASKGDEDVCVYGRAVSNLAELGQVFGLSLTEELGRQIYLILHEWAVRRGDFQDAEELMSLLLSNLRPLERKAMKPLQQMKLQEAFMYSQQGEFGKSRVVMNDLLSSYKGDISTPDEARLLLHRAIHHIGSAPEYCVNAIAPVVECLSLCKQFHLDGTQGPALAVLGHMLFGMNETELSLSTLRVAILALLQSDHVWFQGHAFLTIAKCHLRLAKQAPGSSGRSPKRKVRSALKYLARAESVLSSCHDAKGLKEIYYLQARLYASPEAFDEVAKTKAADNFVAVSRHMAAGASRVDAFRASPTQKHLFEMSGRPFPQRV